MELGAMSESPKLLYVVVVDEGVLGEDSGREGSSSFRYTRPVLQSTLQLMGCKARHAFKISSRVYESLRTEGSEVCVWNPSTRNENHIHDSGTIFQTEFTSCEGIADTSHKIPFELYKRLTTVVVPRETFLNVVCEALSVYKYVGPNQRADLMLACRIRERKESVTILLCGTSGCGKSTLSSLLGSRLGITTVVSTDSIRHMMRSFADEKQNPLLWASTYHAGECLDPVAVAEAKAKRKAKKLAGLPHSMNKEESSDGAPNVKQDALWPEIASGGALIRKKQMAIEGYKAQSEMVIDSLDRLITAWEQQKESVIVEGVHLSLNFLMGLMKKHHSIIPFMIYITNEEKHTERFAVRAKYMTLDPARNKYVKYIRNIRTIQEYLCNRADKHLVPKINNTNVDRSVAAIHATVFGCLRRRDLGEQLYDAATNTIPVIYEEYRKQCAANSLSSKGMFQLIRRKGSSRQLMALVKTDGSVAKAWPVEADSSGKLSSGNGGDKCVGNLMYGPVQIGNAEPVNLQFGSFGISAWPNDTVGTSQAGSLDDYRAEGTDSGSRYYSSCCNSPLMSDVPAKELKEESSVSVSEEEADDPPEIDSDDDTSGVSEGGGDEAHDIEGSVDEESTKSDEEYEDLAMRDDQDNGCWTDDDEDLINHGRKDATAAEEKEDLTDGKYRQNLDLFLKTNGRESAAAVLPRSYSLFPERNSRRGSDMRIVKRSLSASSRTHCRPPPPTPTPTPATLKPSDVCRT